MKPVSVALSCFVVVALAASLVGVGTVQGMILNQQTTVSVNIGINYGTGPVEWHNNTAVPSGENLLNATMRVATVDFKSYPGLGEFVTGINGRSQDPAASLYWMFWIYNPQTQQYELPSVGAGSYLLTSDQTVQWYLSSSTLGPNTSVSLNARLDTSTDPPTAVISGSIHPTPMAPVNVTLEYSQNQGANYLEIARITSGADGTFSYSWKLPGGGMFMIRADTQGVKSSPATIGVSNGAPGFPLESLLIGSALGLLFLILRRRRRSPSHK
ncbi:MAG: DUF4430 domain-containing protein [Candidatus Bathyarchaeia archaeon]|jgi:hypothetical protein